MAQIGRWPIEYGDQLILGNLSSNLAICCFWSSKEHLGAVLDPTKFAVIGSLYSRAGISPMLRNILANPVIRYLVLTGNSLTDSDRALVDFFNGGVDEDWRIVGNGGQVDRDLPLAALQHLRRNVTTIDLRGVSNFASEFHRIAENLKEDYII